MSQTNTRHRPLTTVQTMLRLGMIQPGMFILAFVLWTAFYCFPLLVGLLVREFFDALTGSAAAHFDAWTAIGLLVAAEAGQVLRNYQRARGSGIRKLDHRDRVFIMVDVDFFKQVNDRHGHPAGDRLLQLVAQRLSTVVRKSDVLVRWGGEEFLIMSRSTDPSGTPAFCSRVLEVMSA